MIKAHNTIRKWQQVKDFVHDGLNKIHESEKIFNSQFTLQLEEQLQKASGKKYALTCASGSHAITISLLANNIGWGNKVIVPNYSCPATLSSIGVIGCVPVFCEVNKFGSLDADKLQLLSQTGAKAVLATGLYGDVHDHDPIAKFCKDNNMVYINDAAQSQFALHNGTNCLALGDVVCMSFADNKPIPVAGTYGAILTDDEILKEKIRILRKNGKPSRLEDYETAGFSSQPEEEKAVQVLASWQHFDKWQDRRAQITKYYDEQFKGKIKTRPRPSYSKWNHHKYAVMVDDKFKAYKLMLEKGVETEQHYVDNFSKLFWTPITFEDFDMTDRFIKNSLTIPNNPFMTDSEVEVVAKTVINNLCSATYQ
jgi:UDP-2-acetamido-2-deoxy-ribo-hexuluronate aminotransferase